MLSEKYTFDGTMERQKALAFLLKAKLGSFLSDLQHRKTLKTIKYHQMMAIQQKQSAPYNFVKSALYNFVPQGKPACQGSQAKQDLNVGQDLNFSATLNTNQSIITPTNTTWFDDNNMPPGTTGTKTSGNKSDRHWRDDYNYGAHPHNGFALSTRTLISIETIAVLATILSAIWLVVTLNHSAEYHMSQTNISGNPNISAQPIIFTVREQTAQPNGGKANYLANINQSNTNQTANNGFAGYNMVREQTAQPIGDGYPIYMPPSNMDSSRIHSSNINGFIHSQAAYNTAKIILIDQTDVNQNRTFGLPNISSVPTAHGLAQTDQSDECLAKGNQNPENTRQTANSALPTLPAQSGCPIMGTISHGQNEMIVPNQNADQMIKN